MVCIWVFTRCVDLAERAVELCSTHATIDVMAIGKQLHSEFPSWKQSMPSASRDYTVNTCNLDGRLLENWIFKGFAAIYNVIKDSEAGVAPGQLPMVANELNSQIANCGGFILQHLCWTLRLCGYVQPGATDSWISVRVYTSRQNTLELFRLFKQSFCSTTSSRPVLGERCFQGIATIGHVFFNPLLMRPRITHAEAGDFLVSVYREYARLVKTLADYEFGVETVGDGEATILENNIFSS